jgi:hypothetical protein
MIDFEYWPAQSFDFTTAEDVCATRVARSCSICFCEAVAAVKSWTAVAFDERNAWLLLLVNWAICCCSAAWLEAVLAMSESR